MNRMKIERGDILDLTRRMTPKRTSMTRIAGSYMDRSGEIDGTFNINFLKLSEKEKEKNLAIGKTIPFAKTNVNLVRYVFSEKSMKPGSMWQLLMGMKSCGLKNDELMDVFYDMIGRYYQTNHDYGVFIFHDRYDIPRKAADHQRLGESEETFEYLICAICPVTGDYEPGEPEWGFLFPAYYEKSGAINFIDVFDADERHPHMELLSMLGLS